jgi:hypothetical protein
MLHSINFLLIYAKTHTIVYDRLYPWNPSYFLFTIKFALFSFNANELIHFLLTLNKLYLYFIIYKLKIVYAFSNDLFLTNPSTIIELNY